jgi:predicted nucleotidyltransferase
VPEEEEKERYLSAQDDVETWSRVLKESAHILDEAGIPYAAIGSIATTAMGYDESCSDIDLLVSPDNAERALETFEQRGYRVERTEPEWLYKAVKDRVLVDLIFKVGDRNEMRADEEMFRRTSETDVHGQRVQVVAAEDFLVMQAVSNKRDAPDYWFKGLKAAACEGLDWDYVLQRARVAPIRVLSLLLYARSEGNDSIPRRALDSLYDAVG